MPLNFYRAEIPEITVQKLKELMGSDDCPIIVDVRQPEERDIACIGGICVPLGELSDRIEELEPYKTSRMVVYCRSGSRSARAVEYMRAMGFDLAENLKGGIAAWSRAIDPSIPTY